MNRMGWKKSEPMPLPDDIELPRVLKNLISAHTERLGFTSEELSRLFGLPQQEVEEDFVLTKSRQQLRLVISN